jgi:hypothetical protein
MTPKANSWTSMGRLALYGPAAARLQEEIIQVTAVWTDAECDRKPLKPFGEVGKAKTLGRNPLRELGLIPERQTQVQSAEAGAHIEQDTDKPALRDPWGFVAAVFGWEPRHVAGSPGGPALPENLMVRLPEHDTTLAPTWVAKVRSRYSCHRFGARRVGLGRCSELVDHIYETIHARDKRSSRSWSFLHRMSGKAHRYTIGVFPKVSLAEARLRGFIHLSQSVGTTPDWPIGGSP